MSKEKNLNEFTIDALVIKTFNDIASWHNDDTSAPGLKQLTLDIINNVAGEVCKHFDIPYTGEIKLDQEAKKEALSQKKS